MHRVPDLTPAPSRSRAERASDAQAEHNRRHQVARALAQPHDGVVTRRMLAGAGLTRGQVRTEVESGAWHVAGRHTLAVTSVAPQGAGLWWRALWESGQHSVLDGPTALLAGGLRGWTEELVHVTVPNRARVRAIEGVRHHRVRDRGPIIDAGLRRTRPEVAALRAAMWAASDRQAATVLAMSIQQRLVPADRVLQRWGDVAASPRRRFLDAVIRDLCDGAHSLGELDFARFCRERGIAEPTRQAVRTGARGRVYLDAWWENSGVHAEINGAHHQQGLAPVDDALRANDVALKGPTISLVIPVLGLRTDPERFLDQVARALDIGRRRLAAG